jgi:hypothetical protein
MLFKSSSHVLLLALGVVVIAVAAVLVVDLGFFDAIFHTNAQATLDG